LIRPVFPYNCVNLSNKWLAYLKDAYTQAKEKFNAPATEPEQQEAQTAPAVNEIKSNGVLNGLKLSIENAEIWMPSQLLHKQFVTVSPI